MFFNRSVEVKLVKNPKAHHAIIPSEAETETAVDYVPLVREGADQVAKTVLIVMGAYFALSTLKEVVVKSTPEK